MLTVFMVAQKLKLLKGRSVTSHPTPPSKKLMQHGFKSERFYPQAGKLQKI